MTEVEVINGTVIWNPPGGEITGYDVSFFAGGEEIHIREVTDTWYTPPESAQRARNARVHCW